MDTTTVSAVMTPNPITVRTDTPFKEIAELLTGNEISAVGVTDKRGRLVGVVSEADLLPHCGPRPETRRLPWLRSKKKRSAARKSAGRVAGDLMTTPAVTVPADESVAEAARRFARLGVRRLFVTRQDALVGVLSRRDLVSVFTGKDREIQRRIERDVLLGRLGLGPERVRVSVIAGVVTVVGRLERKSGIAAVTPLVEDVPGVVAVDNRLDYVWNDA